MSESSLIEFVFSRNLGNMNDFGLVLHYLKCKKLI